jgi:hypothetical protein
MDTKYRRVVKETVWDGSAFVQKEFFIIKDRIEVGMWLECGWNSITNASLGEHGGQHMMGLQ